MKITAIHWDMLLDLLDLCHLASHGEVFLTDLWRVRPIAKGFGRTERARKDHLWKAFGRMRDFARENLGGFTLTTIRSHDGEEVPRGSSGSTLPPTRIEIEDPIGLLEAVREAIDSLSESGAKYVPQRGRCA